MAALELHTGGNNCNGDLDKTPSKEHVEQQTGLLASLPVAIHRRSADGGLDRNTLRKTWMHLSDAINHQVNSEWSAESQSGSTTCLAGVIGRQPIRRTWRLLKYVSDSSVKLVDRLNSLLVAARTDVTNKTTLETLPT